MPSLLSLHSLISTLQILSKQKSHHSILLFETQSGKSANSYFSPPDNPFCFWRPLWPPFPLLSPLLMLVPFFASGTHHASPESSSLDYRMARTLFSGLRTNIPSHHSIEDSTSTPAEYFLTVLSTLQYTMYFFFNSFHHHLLQVYAAEEQRPSYIHCYFPSA